MRGRVGRGRPTRRDIEATMRVVTMRDLAGTDI